MNMHHTGPDTPGAAFTLSPNSFARSPQRWLYYGPSRGTWLDELAPSFRAPTDLLVRWLIEQGPRYQVELRIGTAGIYEGVWLGICGVGATPRQAERLGRQGSRALIEATAGFHWRLHTRKAARLPQQRCHLTTTQTNARFRTAKDKRLSLPILNHIARPGVPLVLRIRARLWNSQPELVRHAAEAVEQAEINLGTAYEHCGPRTIDNTRRERALLHEAHRVLEEAAGLQLSVSLHSPRLPSTLPLRLLSDTLTLDLQRTVRWQAEPAWVPADIDVLGDFIHVLSASRKPSGKPPYPIRITR